MRLLLVVSVWCGVAAFVPTHVLQRKIALTKPFFQSTIEVDANVVKEEYMPAELLPPEYNRPAIASHRLSRIQIQKAIVDVKKFVENRFETNLNLIKVRPDDPSCGATLLLQHARVLH